MSFTHFSLHPGLLETVAEQGFTAPTPIQERAIPPAMEGRDVLGLAQTGTGKTAAFVLPMLDSLHEGPLNVVRGLVVAPTRELAGQIHNDIRLFARRTRLRSVPIFGGVGFHGQVLQMRAGAEILVACPGRLLDHVRQGTVDLSAVEVLVLDEADMMFDMGFLDDVREILRLTRTRRQTLMFSATMPEPVQKLVEDNMRHPVLVEVNTACPAETVSHALYPVAPHLKTPLLKTMLRTLGYDSMLVFTRTRHGARRLWQQLGKVGFNVACLQGNLSQRRRQAALEGFRRGKYAVLVATDIAARGLDISSVSHVINYDFPPTADTYIHRIGRTGRACRTGKAITFVTPEDEPMVRTLERAMGEPLPVCLVPGFDYSEDRRSMDARPAKAPRVPRPKRVARAFMPTQVEHETPDALRNQRPPRQPAPHAGNARGIFHPQPPQGGAEAGKSPGTGKAGSVVPGRSQKNAAGAGGRSKGMQAAQGMQAAARPRGGKVPAPSPAGRGQEACADRDTRAETPVKKTGGEPEGGKNRQ